MPRCRLAGGLILLALTPVGVVCGTINLGVLSLDDSLIGSGTPGVSNFSFSNFTGNPVSGGFALPPDFPVLTPLTFLNSTLAVVVNGAPQTFALGNIGPGSLDNAAQFASNAVFTSAVFSGVLSQSNFALAGGGTFTVVGLNITATLLPQSGAFLRPGTDLAIITASDAPEPGTAFLAGVALTLLAALVRIKLPRNR